MEGLSLITFSQQTFSLVNNQSNSHVPGVSSRDFEPIKPVLIAHHRCEKRAVSVPGILHAGSLGSEPIVNIIRFTCAFSAVINIRVKKNVHENKASNTFSHSVIYAFSSLWTCEKGLSDSRPLFSQAVTNNKDNADT